MSIRRNFRIKVLQFLYAQQISKVDLKKVEKNMLDSIKNLHDLHVSLLCLILVIRNCIIKNEKKYNELSFAKNFAYNSIMNQLFNNKYIIESYKSSKNIWIKKNTFIYSFLNKMKNLSIKKSFSSFQEEKKFIKKVYQDFFIKNNNLIDYIEDFYGIENLFIVHNIILKMIDFLKKNNKQNINFNLYKIYSNEKNKKFIINLYRNTIIHQKKFNQLIEMISNNWKINRITVLDLIILKMAICEFLYFPEIPPKVTINEYIELTKVFCMEKSKIFINGILDQAYKLLKKKNKINKL